MRAICDVCLLVDNDKTIKEVTYCKECNAYICTECYPNWFRRGMAAIKQKLNGRVES